MHRGLVEIRQRTTILFKWNGARIVELVRLSFTKYMKVHRPHITFKFNFTYINIKQPEYIIQCSVLEISFYKLENCVKEVNFDYKFNYTLMKIKPKKKN